MIIVNPINASAFGATEHGDMRSNHASGSVPLNRANPNPNDVICARGKRAYNHPGNVRFRRMIEDQVEAYKQAKTRIEKTLIVSQIIDAVRENSGGFIRQDDGQWVEVGDTAAREKVGQGFRDILHTKYRSSTKAKKIRKIKSLTSYGGETSEHEGLSGSSSICEADEPSLKKSLNDASGDGKVSPLPFIPNKCLNHPVVSAKKMETSVKESMNGANGIFPCSQYPLPHSSTCDSVRMLVPMDKLCSGESSADVSKTYDCDDDSFVCPPPPLLQSISSGFEPVAIENVFSRTLTENFCASFVTVLNDLIEWDD